MFERLLAIRYVKAQKRHSIFTICSIAAALALMTLLFIGYATYTGIQRDAAYADKPYHFKLMSLTEEEFAQLAANPDFTSCKRVTEANGSLSAEIMLGTYHDDFGMYIYSLFPEKYLYSDLKETFKEDLVDVNFALVDLDRLDFTSKYYAVYNLALFFIFILVLVLMLRVMIDTAFEISSKERERQYGILQCAGAEPKQIVRIILFEALFLSVIGIPLGILLGLGLSFGAFEAIKSSGIAEVFFTADKIPEIMKLHFSPLLILLGAVTGFVWVLLSAYQTGMRVIKLSPVQAVTGRGKKVPKVRQFGLFGLLFGWKGKMAERNNRRQPKRFAITVVSLTLSIMLFATFSIVLKQSLGAFEKAVDLLGLNYDFGVNIKVDPAEPASYREGLDKIRESGYFEINSFKKSQYAFIPYDEENSISCLLVYYPREIFDAQFEGGSPVSYEELTEQKQFLLLQPADQDDAVFAETFQDMEQFAVNVQARSLVTEEAFAAMSAGEQAEVKQSVFKDPTTGEQTLEYRYTVDFLPADITVAAIAKERVLDEDAQKFQGSSQYDSGMLTFVSTLDAYENGLCDLAGSYGSVVNYQGVDNILLDLKNENDYEKALTFLKTESETLTIEENFYNDLRQARATVGAVQIGTAFLSVLIGLIALVNLVNILSTGILNRRAEIAALQCIGMTQGQLNAMTVIECLQYALTSGVLATVLIELLLLAMYLFLKSIGLEEAFGQMLNYTAPIPLIWIAALVAFAASVCASFLPLSAMQKESLTDQIRCVE